jgi:hypothetical protein
VVIKDNNKRIYKLLKPSLVLLAVVSLSIHAQETVQPASSKPFELSEISDSELTAISGQIGSPEEIQQDIDSSITAASSVRDVPLEVQQSHISLPGRSVIFNGQETNHFK